MLFLFLLTGAFLKPVQTESFSIHLFVFVCNFWLKFLQNRRFFSARACIACRNTHFSSPHRVAIFSACCRILVLIPEKIRPEGGITVCFFPHVFLFEAGKAFPLEEQRVCRRLRWLTCPVFPSARPAPPMCICQAKAVFR